MTAPNPSTAVRPRPRRRILQAALELIVEGGYDAVQVRALSERAGVSSRTIYTHFPSLDSLIIVAVAEQSQPLYGRFTQSPPSGSTASERVGRLIAELTETMTANRMVTMALLRALLTGKSEVSQFVRGFGDVLQTMLATAIAPDGPTDRDREVAEILESIWFSSLIGWASGTNTDRHMSEIMQRAVRNLLPER